MPIFYTSSWPVLQAAFPKSYRATEPKWEQDVHRQVQAYPPLSSGGSVGSNLALMLSVLGTARFPSLPPYLLLLPVTRDHSTPSSHNELHLLQMLLLNTRGLTPENESGTRCALRMGSRRRNVRQGIKASYS